MSANHNVTVADYDAALLRLVDLAVNDNVIAAAINAGGTGYTVGDILTVSGGTVVSSLTCTLEVTSETGGVIDGIRVFNCGAYSSQPGNPVSVTGGTGNDDATFNLTFETQNWTLNRNDAATTSLIDFPTTQGGGGTQILGREVLLEGPGNAGADEIYIGFLEVEEAGSGSFVWHISGMTGFDGGSRYENQPGFSYISPDEIAAFVALANASIECWFHVTPRSLKGVCRIGTSYVNFYAGFLNPYATPSEYPYPLYFSGSTTKWDEVPTTSGVAQSGLCDPGANTQSRGNDRGPAGLRFFDGTWQNFRNWTFNGTSRSAVADRTVYPCRVFNAQSGFIPADDQFVANAVGFRWQEIIAPSGNPGSPDQFLFPTDDSGGNLTQLVPTIVISTSPSAQIIGELQDVLWGATNGNNIVSEDRVIIGGEYYRAFQNCNRTDPFAFVFLREDA